MATHPLQRSGQVHATVAKVGNPQTGAYKTLLVAMGAFSTARVMARVMGHLTMRCQGETKE